MAFKLVDMKCSSCQHTWENLMDRECVFDTEYPETCPECKHEGATIIPSPTAHVWLAGEKQKADLKEMSEALRLRAKASDKPHGSKERQELTSAAKDIEKTKDARGQRVF